MVLRNENRTTRSCILQDREDLFRRPSARARRLARARPRRSATPRTREEGAPHAGMPSGGRAGRRGRRGPCVKESRRRRESSKRDARASSSAAVALRRRRRFLGRRAPPTARRASKRRAVVASGAARRQFALAGNAHDPRSRSLALCRGPVACRAAAPPRACLRLPVQKRCDCRKEWNPRSRVLK